MGQVDEIQKALGLTLADVQRLTVVVPDPANPEKEVWAVVSLGKDYDKKKLLESPFGKDFKPAKHKDKEYYKNDAEKMAIAFVSDRIILAGPEAGVQKALDLPATPADGPLGEALKTATMVKYQVVAGVNPPAAALKMAKDGIKGNPITANMKGLPELVDLRTVVVAGTVGDDVNLEVSVNYPDAATAGKAAEGFNGLMGLVRFTVPPTVKQQLDQAKVPDSDKLVKALSDLLAPIKGQADGAAMRVDVKITADMLKTAAEAGFMVQQLGVGRPGGPGRSRPPGGPQK
jgi:hypothetical protein